MNASPDTQKLVRALAGAILDRLERNPRALFPIAFVDEIPEVKESTLDLAQRRALVASMRDAGLIDVQRDRLQITSTGREFASTVRMINRLASSFAAGDVSREELERQAAVASRARTLVGKQSPAFRVLSAQIDAIENIIAVA